MSSNAVPLLQVSGLRLGYGGRTVLDDVSFVLESGTWLGLLGANGAGKSTLLRALTGQLRPAAGTIALCGLDVVREPTAVRARLGCAVDPSELPMPLSGAQYLDLVASARQLPAPAWPAGDLPAILGLLPWMNAALGDCSLGTRAKVALCAALLGEPELLVLDESLNGLDPLGSWQVRRAVSEQVSRTGCAVILATHALPIVTACCDRALFLDAGRIARTWSAAELARFRTEGSRFEDEVMTVLLAERARREDTGRDDPGRNGSGRHSASAAGAAPPPVRS